MLTDKMVTLATVGLGQFCDTCPCVALDTPVLVLIPIIGSMMVHKAELEFYNNMYLTMGFINHPSKPEETSYRGPYRDHFSGLQPAPSSPQERLYSPTHISKTSILHL